MRRPRLDLSIHSVVLLHGHQPVAHFSNLPLAVITGFERGGDDYTVKEQGEPELPVRSYSVNYIHGGLVYVGPKTQAVR
jgi:hypothetical protein